MNEMRMKAPPRQFASAPPPPQDFERKVLSVGKILVVVLIEAAAVILHYSIYSEILSQLPGSYLSEVPGLEWLASGDMTISSLLAGFMALVSVATPVIAFSFIISKRLIEDPATFFAYPPHRIYAAVLSLFWVLMIVIELLAAQRLVEMYAQNPFAQGGAAAALRENTPLAWLCALVVCLVNMGLGFGSAVVWQRLLSKES